MTEYTFKVGLNGITDLDCFKEASKDELKILIALKSTEGETVSIEPLAQKLGVSVARIKATIALFEESGVLTKRANDFLAEVEYEFEVKKKTCDTPLESAKSIRDNNLYELFNEIENIFGKTLETREIERIESLYTKKGLSVEYILMLAAHQNDTRMTPTIESLVREATRLQANDIDNLESLEIYLKEKADEIAGEAEMRQILGIRGRAFSKSERAFFKKWMHDYCYGTTIIGEAYDITVGATGKLSLSYMDKILTEWFKSGCRTLDDCRARVNIRKQERADKAKKSSQKSNKTVEAETPKYTDFNSEDALLKALERSYGE